MKIIVYKQFENNGISIPANEIKFKNRVPVFLNFEQKLPVTAELSCENNILYADIDFSDEHQLLYPALGIRYDNETKESNVFSIGLCSRPNIDPSIKRIDDQILDILLS